MGILKSISKYVVASVGVGVATAPSLLLLHFGHLGTIVPFLFLILGCFWYFGWGPGCLAFLLSEFAVWYVVVPPHYSYALDHKFIGPYVSYTIGSALLALVAIGRRRAESNLREVVGLLEQEVEDRTTKLEAELAEKAIAQESTKKISVELELHREREARKETELRELHRRVEALTERERQIFGFIVFGLLNKEIAAKLGIAEVTVKVHRANLMRKMGAKNSAELIRRGERLGIETPSRAAIYTPLKKSN